MDAEACNFNAEATDPANDCTFSEPYLDCTGSCVNDSDGDGFCDELEIAGCMDLAACNFNTTATDDDGSCILPEGCGSCSGEQDGSGTLIANDDDNDGVCNADETIGCTDGNACNFDANPTTDSNNALCVYPSDCDTCSGEQDGTGIVIVGDTDGNGICDSEEEWGCTYESACNYSSVANVDDGTCTFAESGFDCAGDCTMDLNGNGVCDFDEVEWFGNQLESGEYCAPGTVWNTDLGQCVSSHCLGDFNQDAGIGAPDLLFFLSRYDTLCEMGGCTDQTALNYVPSADYDDGSCMY